MSTLAIDALHDIHTATNDVLKGYREMAARAEPDIRRVIDRLTELHQRHAAEQASELQRARETTAGDSSLQGTVNKVVVMVRDWVSDLDRDVLPAVRQGEESLRDDYDEALAAPEVSGHATIGVLLTAQRMALDAEIARLPQG
jgi:Domain of unknown function (DUF2383)